MYRWKPAPVEGPIDLGKESMTPKASNLPWSSIIIAGCICLIIIGFVGVYVYVNVAVSSTSNNAFVWDKILGIIFPKAPIDLSSSLVTLTTGPPVAPLNMFGNTQKRKGPISGLESTEQRINMRTLLQSVKDKSELTEQTLAEVTTTVQTIITEQTSQTSTLASQDTILRNYEPRIGTLEQLPRITVLDAESWGIPKNLHVSDLHASGKRFLDYVQAFDGLLFNITTNTGAFNYTEYLDRRIDERLYFIDGITLGTEFSFTSLGVVTGVNDIVGGNVSLVELQRYTTELNDITNTTKKKLSNLTDDFNLFKVAVDTSLGQLRDVGNETTTRVDALEVDLRTFKPQIGSTIQNVDTKYQNITNQTNTRVTVIERDLIRVNSTTNTVLGMNTALMNMIQAQMSTIQSLSDALSTATRDIATLTERLNSMPPLERIIGILDERGQSSIVREGIKEGVTTIVCNLIGLEASGYIKIIAITDKGIDLESTGSERDARYQYHCMLSL